MEALHRDGSAAEMRQHDGRDRLVVGGELPLGDAVVREEDFLGMRDRDHEGGLVTSWGDRSVRMPNKRECRSLPCTVHSMNATVTTTSGFTQCARTRGSPVATVNGGLGISVASNCARSSRSNAW